MRKVPLVEGEFYHVYNRGVDRRTIFKSMRDLERFFQSMQEFNTVEPIGSIFENSFNKDRNKKLDEQKLVQFIAYCLNPNHFHFILTQLIERGVEKFMHRLGTGYTKYFNEKHSRSGALFQGVFKSNHINSNEYLLHAGIYVNLNYKVHKLEEGRHLFKSSWPEYENPETAGICEKEIILGQFKTRKSFNNFVDDSLISILKRKDFLIELENMAKNKSLEAKLPSR